MALENTVQIGFTSIKNGTTISQNTSLQITMASDPVIDSVMSVAVAGTVQLPVGAVATSGYAYFKNIDTTNSIHLSSSSAGANKFCTLLPGQAALFPLNNLTLFPQSSAGTPNLVYSLVST